MFNTYFSKRTSNLTKEEQEDILFVFNEVKDTLKTSKVVELKSVLDLLIVEKQKEHMKKQVKKLTNN